MHDEIRAAIEQSLEEANVGRIYTRLRFFTTAAEVKAAYTIDEAGTPVLQAAITYRISLLRSDNRMTRRGDEIPRQRRHTFRILLLRGFLDATDSEKAAQDLFDRVVEVFDTPEVRDRFRAIRVKILPIEAVPMGHTTWEGIVMHQADMRLECLELI